MMMFTQEQQLGQVLVSQGKLDPDDLEQAIREHNKSGERLAGVLVRMGLTSDEDVQRALAEQLQMPFVRLGDRQIEKSVLEKIPAKLVNHYNLVPLEQNNGTLRVAVVERHHYSGNIGRGFVKGFGFREGALAASVGHDSHNVTVVGADTGDMAAAVNRLIELGGGFVAVRDGKVLAELPLPVAGLMSDRPFAEVAAALKPLHAATQAMGCSLADPFIQMAFLALPVIPHLKITDRGLVDVDRFELIAA